MRLYLFDDARARSWSPFRLTRPVGELRFGCLLLRERAEAYWNVECAGHVAGPELAGFSEEGAPPVVASGEISVDEDRLLLSSRYIPVWNGDARSATVEGEVGEGEVGPEVQDGPGAATMPVVCDGVTIGWRIAAGAPNPPDEALLEPDAGFHPGGDGVGAVGGKGSGSSLEVDGRILEQPWDLMAGNAEQIRRDVPHLHPHSGAFLPAHATQIGDDHPISLGHDVELEPGVIFDVRHGPVILEDRVVVGAHTRLEGPLHVAAGTTLLGGSISSSSIGPRCKIRGEVEESVVLGFSNKAHDGFLGHAYVGRWVNLGALTTNSDLKNNYGPVRLRRGDEEIDTGLMKVGCFLGDHVKTGIGTLLTTGAVVGAGSNLFGGGMAPAWVPPFSWGGRDGLVDHRIDAFLETAARAMARRDVELAAGMADLFRRAHEATHRLR